MAFIMYSNRLWRELSRDHGQFGACVLVFEKPVAHINGQVNLLALDDLELAFVLLHVDGNELVADLGRVLRCIY